MSELIAIELPERDTPGDVAGAYFTMTAAFGRELGDRYDAHLSKTIGPNWLPALSSIHGKPLTLHDPDFVLSEPYYNSHSPTREVLPRGVEFYDDLKRALTVRHAWAHYNEPATLERLEVAAKRFQKVSTAVGMAFTEQCKQLRTRIRDIREGRYFPAAPATLGPTPEEVAETAAEQARLEQDLALAQEAAQRAADELAEAQAQQQMQGRALDGLIDSLDQAEEQRAALAAEVLRLKERLERARFVQTAEQAASRQARGPIPAVGAPWPYPEEGRELRLVSGSRDLLDPATAESLLETHGEPARQAVERWLGYLPSGGRITLTADGHAMAWVGPTLTYLGRIDGSSDDPDSVQGFFTVAEYTVLPGGEVRDDATGALLSASSTGSAALRAVLADALPDGGDIRVTTEGVVAHFGEDEMWRRITQVPPGAWFSG